MTRWIACGAALLWLCSTGLFAEEPAAEASPAKVVVAPDPTEKLYEDLLAEHAATMVTVNYVLTADFSGTPQRVQGEIEGMLISAEGLILIPASAIDPSKQYEAVYRDMGVASSIPRISSSAFQATLVGHSGKFEAKIVSRDIDLGIAWLRLTEPPANLDFVDLSVGGTPRLGQRALVLSLASEQFDFAPYVTEVRVQGRIDVPYPAFVVTWPNKLVFDTDLKPMGFGVLTISGQPGLMSTGGFKSFTVMIPRAKLAELSAEVVSLDAASE